MEKKRLGDICEIVTGATPKTNIKEFWDGDINWITPAELTEDTYIINESLRKITTEGVEKTGLKSFPKGTVILSSRAPIGKVAIAGCEMYCNQGFKNLVCSKQINNRFLYWYLKGHKEYLNSLGRGATFKEISKAIVENIEICLPTLEKQEKYADILEQCNGIIQIKKGQLRKLDTLVKSRFVELFGDPVINSRGWKKALIGDDCFVTKLAGFEYTQYINYEDSGDVVMVKAGTIHAIGAGIFICEIQQNSNCTYRMYDYDRRDKFGNPRELHVAKSLDVVNPVKYEKDNKCNVMLTHNEHYIARRLVQCKYFEVIKYEVEDEAKIPVDETSFVSVIVVEGEGTIKTDDYDKEIHFKAGESFFISAGKRNIIVKGKSTCIITHV